jgi:general secretion pathway protein E
LGIAKDATVYRPVGCEHCNHTGYRGRTGIHELLPINDQVRDMIHAGSSEQEIEHAVRPFCPSIRQDGVDKVLQGITSLEEVLRVTREG